MRPGFHTFFLPRHPLLFPGSIGGVRLRHGRQRCDSGISLLSVANWGRVVLPQVMHLAAFALLNDRINIGNPQINENYCHQNAYRR